MNDIDPKPKRKNDDKAKRRPGLRMAAAAILIGMFLGVTVLLALLRPTPVLYPHFPAASLFYTSGGHPYTINLQTGERTAAEWPGFTAHPNDPADIREVYAQLATGEYRDFTSSPNNHWWIGWKNLGGQWELELLLYDRTGGQPPHSLGTFYGVFHGTRISWSSDSQWITFSAQPPPPDDERRSSEAEEVWLMAIGTGQLIRLTNNNVRDSMPNFSPDGTQIVYTSALDGYLRLYVMDLATRESRLLTPDLYGYNAAWSPDGQWIAFHTNSYAPSGDIWIIRSDGINAQAIIHSDADDRDPIWLP